MRIVISACFLCLAGAALPAYATEYARLDGCDAEAGIGIITYGRLTGLRVEDLNVITDICFDRVNKTIMSAESATGLVLTEQGPIGEEYQIIFDPNLPFGRESVSVYATTASPFDEHGESMMQITQEISWLKAEEHRPLDRAGWLTGWLKGFVGGETYAGALATRTYAVGGSVFVTTTDGEIHNLSGLGFALGGAIEIQNDNAIGRLSTPPEMSFVSNTDLSFRLVNSGGVLNGDGQFSTRNPVLAGATPLTWQSLQTDITTLVGRAVGPGGRELQMVAEMSGTATRFDGGVVPITIILQLAAERR